jgi:hypothetical protein
VVDTDRFDPVPDGAAKIGGVTLQIIPDYWVLEFDALGEARSIESRLGKRLDCTVRIGPGSPQSSSGPIPAIHGDRNVGRRRVDHQQQTIGVYIDMALAFDDLLGGVMAPRFRFGRFDQLTVDDAFPLGLLHAPRSSRATNSALYAMSAGGNNR